MNILFLLSSLEPAGSETYCVALAKAWQGKHQISWISDRLHYGQPYQPMAISRKAFPGGFINTLRVAAFVRHHRIQIIHSHSRRAHWVAAQAARLSGARHVTTIHQPPPVHVYSKMFPCFGDQIIAIDEAIVDHLKKDFGVPAGKIHLIRNGIDLSQFAPILRAPGAPKKILVIGRLTGGRWKTFQFFLEVIQRIARTLPPARYQIVGRIPDERRAPLNRQLAEIRSALGVSTIEMLGHVNDMGSTIRDSDAMIASGRSALESMACGKAVILLGEGGILGSANPGTWTEALRTNLGDHLEPKQFNPAKLEVALRELLMNDAAAAQLGTWGRDQVEQFYDVRNVSRDVEKVYQCLISPS